MKLVSWNVNGIRSAHRKGFLDWLAEAQPDVLCLQEVRAWPEQLGPELLTEHGYHVTWGLAKKKGYSGVATFSKVPPDEVQVGLGESRFDDEGRVVITRHGDLTVFNGYFPNGQRDLGRVPYKTDYYRATLAWAEAERARGQRVTICGDWNTAHHEIDLKNPKPNRKCTGFLPEECALLDEFEAAGWIDSFRRLHPDEKDRYSWWSNRKGVRARNVGWRIDYFWVAPELWPSVTDAEIRDQVMGSDHCPVELTLK